ncbi:acyltransferase [Flavobacterium sp. LPB0248]|uniref:acyltransferase family protein n=1 Tax=Flavobacterium sp. LPB0248 TaxID=2614441 RepID=UPI0015A5FE36|nr:acyltransferase [Flavobacterium sp. LPB0248]QLC65342.1 acyltransferase [Flavobacterium sp. LPB0248]
MTLTFLLCFFLILVALIFSVIITNRVVKLDVQEVRYPEIDGLRGYLAFFVFLHHSYIWRFFLQNGEWEEPKSNLFNHFGQTTVAFFFVITAFLFTLKLINSKNKQIDWSAYINARLYRLFPMYLFSVGIIFFIAGYLTNFKSRIPFFENLLHLLSWILFNIRKGLSINGLEDSFLFNAGVTWTLPYEWAFYFLLPLIALFFKLKVNYKTLLLFISTAAVIMIINESSLRHFFPFLGGIIAALVISKNKLGAVLKQKKYAFLAVLLIACSIYFFNSGRKPIPIIITTIVFIIIASGNSFFGLLSSTFSRKFGQITYSIYLLHGILLFILFYFVIGFEQAKDLTELEFWSIISLSIFPLIFISQLTFKYIEHPLMELAKVKLKSSTVKS